MPSSFPVRAAGVLAAATVAATLAASAAAHEAKSGDLVVIHPLVRASLGKVPNTAAYLVIRNTGSRPDRLLGAACACAARTQLHTTVQSGAVARMQPRAGLAVPAGGQVALAPGGDHLMLTGLKQPAESGTMVTLTLRFERAGLVSVPFFVTSRVEQELNSVRHGEHAH